MDNFPTKERQRIKILHGVLVVVCFSLMAMAGWLQTAPVAAAAPAPVDTAKQIATMEARLADWSQLAKYRAANAALAPAADGENRVRKPD